MRLAGLALGWTLALGAAAGPPDAEVLERVADTLRTSGRIDSDLRALCDQIGSRMAGSEGMREASEWAMQAFLSAGLAQVHLEAVPMPLSWQEGETIIEVLEPSEYSLAARSSGLSPAVPKATEWELVDGGKGRPGFISRAPGRFLGKALIVSLDEAGSFEEIGEEQRDAMIALREASRVGAAAVLFVSTRPNRLMYRHVNNLSGRLDPIPSAVLAREDGLRVVRTLRAGGRVRVRVRMPNRIGAAYRTANVIGQIPGADLPDEVVLLGAHLDSWDLGSGCQDNAANAALVLNVARSIAGSGARPRRTLRFVLFGGEEFGLFGSRSYVAAHRDELDRHVAAIVHDMGGGPLTGYSSGGRRDLLPSLERVLDPFDSHGRLRHTDNPYYFSDNFPFMLHGVPSLFGVQDTSGFFLVYHSEADTYDKVRSATVAESAVAAATAMLGIGDMPARFAPRLGQREVLEWARRSGLVRHLEFLGVWDAWRPVFDRNAGGAN